MDIRVRGRDNTPKKDASQCHSALKQEVSPAKQINDIQDPVTQVADVTLNSPLKSPKALPNPYGDHSGIVETVLLASQQQKVVNA